MKNLTTILQNISITNIIGKHDITISSIEIDSRKITNEALFIAIKGTQTDGHQYIDLAIKNGAKAIICETLPSVLNPEITYCQTTNTTTALATIAENFYGHPARNLILTGVTGTNGKTTTATLLYKLFKQAGYSCGLISTVINYINEKPIPATHTTPDSITLNKLLHEMVNEGCTHCFMEVSSHAIDQKRIEGLNFKAAIFTNLTHDHLDYHKTFENYLKTKKKFFDLLPEDAFAIINTDDRNGRIMAQNTKAQIKTYALKSMADITCKIIEAHIQGMLLKLDNTEVWTNFIGDFNAYNLTAVYTCSTLLGIDKNTALQIISTLKPVTGRFDYVISPNNITAVIDYAHTPDALENVLNTINKLLQNKKGNVITVVGAGGNRDKLKRPIMARIASINSTKTILTSDNPRNENPEDILADMKAGLSATQLANTLCITDRREAIKTAIAIAQPGDIILIAGKGHENYQEINGVKYHFDDKEEVQKIFTNSTC